jgi:hypothetical protein
MSDNKELLRVAQYALEYIDGLPKDAQSTASGFDRDWADSVIAEAKAAQPVVLTDDQILRMYEDDIGYLTKDTDVQGILCFARAIESAILAAKEQA